MNTRKPTKTILQLIETSGSGGAENVLISLASSFRGPDFCSIVCLREKGWLYDQLSANRIETYILREHGFFDVRFLLRLKDLIKSKRVSIIHAHEFLMNVYGTIAGLLTGTPVVTTLHGKFYYNDKWRRRVALRLVSQFSHLVSVSEDLCHFLEREIYIPRDRVDVVYNGILVQLFNNAGGQSSIRTELGVTNDCRLVGTVGSLCTVKGHTFFLKAIRAVIDHYPGVLFLLVGEGNQERNLRSEAIALGISNQVRFLGFRSDIPNILRSLDIFVLPSLSECFSLAVLEAMASSLPVVVTDVGDNRTIVNNRETGFVIPPADHEALARKILLLLSDQQAAEAMGAKAKQDVASKYTMDVMISRYKSIYDALLK